MVTWIKLESISKYLLLITSDSILFRILQLSLILIFFFTLINMHIDKLKFGRNLQVERSSASMNILYGTYAGLNGLLVALCLSVEISSNYRIFWTLFDTAISIYICLINPWSRNKIIKWANNLTKIETQWVYYGIYNIKSLFKS